MRTRALLTQVLVANLVVISLAVGAAGLLAGSDDLDLSSPGTNLGAATDGRAETEEVARLEVAFRRMLERLESERRRSASAALDAQEDERARGARDLPDEGNQSP